MRSVPISLHDESRIQGPYRASRARMELKAPLDKRFPTTDLVRAARSAGGECQAHGILRGRFALGSLQSLLGFSKTHLESPERETSVD